MAGTYTLYGASAASAGNNCTKDNDPYTDYTCRTVLGFTSLSAACATKDSGASIVLYWTGSETGSSIVLVSNNTLHANNTSGNVKAVCNDTTTPKCTSDEEDRS